MRLELVTGLAFSVECRGCHAFKMAGSESYPLAPDYKPTQPDRVYTYSDGTETYYCEDCARKHSEGEDTARSKTQFYADTHGDLIL